MAKRFGRPAPSFDDENADSHIVREIRMVREGSGMEGVYDSIASIDEMHASVAEGARKRALYDGILYWLLMILFWCGVISLGAHILRNLHN